MKEDGAREGDRGKGGVSDGHGLGISSERGESKIGAKRSDLTSKGEFESDVPFIWGI